MAQCTNCGRTITCGCQERTASDGKKTCSSCNTQYEQTLQIINANKANEQKLNGQH